MIDQTALPREVRLTGDGGLLPIPRPTVDRTESERSFRMARSSPSTDVMIERSPILHERPNPRDLSELTAGLEHCHTSRPNDDSEDARQKSDAGLTAKQGGGGGCNMAVRSDHSRAERTVDKSIPQRVEGSSAYAGRGKRARFVTVTGRYLSLYSSIGQNWSKWTKMTTDRRRSPFE